MRLLALCPGNDLQLYCIDRRYRAQRRYYDCLHLKAKALAYSDILTGHCRPDTWRGFGRYSKAFGKEAALEVNNADLKAL